MSDIKLLSETKTSYVKVLVDSHVIIDTNYIPYHARCSEEEKAKWLQEWANELISFFHDHRSMDVNSLRVNRIYEERCRQCEKSWEPESFEETEDEPTYVGCAWCGASIETGD